MLTVHECNLSRKIAISDTCTSEHEHLFSALLQHLLCAHHLTSILVLETRKIVLVEIVRPLNQPEGKLHSNV